MCSFQDCARVCTRAKCSLCNVRVHGCQALPLHAHARRCQSAARTLIARAHAGKNEWGGPLSDCCATATRRVLIIQRASLSTVAAHTARRTCELSMSGSRLPRGRGGGGCWWVRRSSVCPRAFPATLASVTQTTRVYTHTREELVKTHRGVSRLGCIDQRHPSRANL